MRVLQAFFCLRVFSTSQAFSKPAHTRVTQIVGCRYLNRKSVIILNVSRKTLSAILNGRAGITPEMAIRLSIAFDTSAESWLNQEAQYDLWLARQKQAQLKVERLAA